MTNYVVNTTNCGDGCYTIEATTGNKKYTRRKTTDQISGTTTQSSNIEWYTTDTTWVDPYIQQHNYDPYTSGTITTTTIPTVTIMPGATKEELDELKKKFDELENFILQKVVDLIAEKEELEFIINELKKRIEDMEDQKI